METSPDNVFCIRWYNLCKVLSMKVSFHKTDRRYVSTGRQHRYNKDNEFDLFRLNINRRCISTDNFLMFTQELIFLHNFAMKVPHQAKLPAVIRLYQPAAGR